VEVSQDVSGNYVIPFQQPYSGYAKALLERQQYPNELLYPGGPPKRPYDVTAHTLPLLFGVDSRFVDQPLGGALFKAVLPSDEARDLYKASDSDGWKAANKAWAGGKSVWRNDAGDFAMSARGAGWHEVKRPRVGLYQSYMANMDEGWTRWLLEQFGFAYTTLRNADVQAGNLHDKFDTIVFADELPNAMRNGHAAGSMPPAFTGGLSTTGEAALKQFADAGGTLVFLNRATGYATQYLGVKATNVLAGVAAKDFYCPGSLLNAKLDTHSPLARGVPENIAIWGESSPAWETSEPSVAKYPDSKVLASGWLLGEDHITGKTALIDARSGNGHIVLFGMRPQYRAQSYLTFKLLFNALVMSL
jgi:hypothetical protein